jgi:hypothetical protein
VSEARAVLRDLSRWQSLPADLAPVGFSERAIERFGANLRPSLDLDWVPVELSRLLATARVSRTAPEWYRPGSSVVRPADAYLVLGTDVVLPLVERGGELRAVTTLMPEDGKKAGW